MYPCCSVKPYETENARNGMFMCVHSKKTTLVIEKWLIKGRRPYLCKWSCTRRHPGEVELANLESHVVDDFGRDFCHPSTWWDIPLSKWVITPVISGLTLLIPFITGVITHLLSGMSHQVVCHLNK